MAERLKRASAPVTCLYPERFGNRTAGGLAIFVREA